MVPRLGPVSSKSCPATTREALKLTDEQNKQLDALQPEFESKLAGIFTADQNKQLKEPPTKAGPGGVGGDVSPQAIRLLPASLENMLKITPSRRRSSMVCKRKRTPAWQEFSWLIRPSNSRRFVLSLSTAGGRPGRRAWETRSTGAIATRRTIPG